MDKDLFRIKDNLSRVPSLSFNYSLKKSSSSSINKALRYTRYIAFVGLCSQLLLGCLPPDPLSASLNSASSLGGGSSSGGTAPVGTAPVIGSNIHCTSGPADLSGVCRNNTPTMGAFEAVETQVVSAAVSSSFAATQQVSIGSTPSTLNITWSPYPGNASGYFVYYGSTSDTATALASDLPIDGANLNTSAPWSATSHRWIWA